MLKVNELRIGNYIGFKNYDQLRGTIKVNARFFSSLAGGRSVYDLKDDEELNERHSGIPITHEIMENCGFYFNHPFYEIKNPSAAGLIKISFDEEDGFVYEFMTRLVFLHQLQNLFYAITGKELIH